MSDEAADEEVPQPTPPRKRRKKKAAPEAAPIVEGEARDRDDGAPAEGADAEARLDLPAFARGFPRDEALDGLVAAFERGDYASVRAGAGRLAKDGESEAVRRAAGELLRRIEPDPLARLLLLAAVGLLAFLSIWYWSHSHAAP